MFRVVADILGDPVIPRCDGETTRKLIKGLQHYPKNKNKYEQFKGKPFSLSMKNDAGFVPLKTRTINSHIEMVSGMFKFAL